MRMPMEMPWMIVTAAIVLFVVVGGLFVAVRIAGARMTKDHPPSHDGDAG